MSGTQNIFHGQNALDLGQDATLVDAALADQIRELATSKIQSRPEAVTVSNVSSEEVTQVMVLSSDDWAAKLQICRSLANVVILDENDYVQRALALDDQVLLLGDLNEAQLRAKLSKIDSGEICSNADVPYGFVDGDGMVIAIFWMTSDVTPRSYVLKGHRMPDELYYDLHVMNDGSWAKRFWALVDEGRMIRLSERMRGLQRYIWEFTDINGARWLRFNARDMLMPTLTTTPYIEWHITESRPGEYVLPVPPASSFNRPVDTWFR